ncbi:hypothetical protein HHK36_006891 [Tetracentron sinense]|uniref:Uncharacterized protein n=1 Tax=Tetracentron sinense TaxID=13715 RepID=A0A834ZLR0_TETSI|nr:hypothetical protein HHK36_006891 [Tetracentron sinense]
MSTVTESRDSALSASIQLVSMAFGLHFLVLFLRLVNPWLTPPRDLPWCALVYHGLGIVCLFCSKYRDPGPSPGSLPYQYQVSDLIRDLAIHTQLAALTIRIFYSNALATLLEIVGLLLIYFFCHVRDLETPKRSQVRPAHVKQPIPNTVIETTVDHEIDIYGGIGQFEAEGFRGYVADSLMQELPNSQSASSGSEAIVKKLDLIIKGLEMLADTFKDANHKSVINKEELYAQVMQIDGIDPDLKLRMFDYIVAHDIGKAFLAVPHGERKDWLLMKIIEGVI